MKCKANVFLKSGNPLVLPPILKFMGKPPGKREPMQIMWESTVSNNFRKPAQIYTQDKYGIWQLFFLT